MNLISMPETTCRNVAASLYRQMAMTEIPESHRDLLQSDVATLATIGPDGRPQLSEVWFIYDDAGSLLVSLNTSRQKSKNLQSRPQCCLFILDLAKPSRYLELRGDAVVTPDMNFVLVDKVRQKYGADVRMHDGPDDLRVVVTISVAKVNAINVGA